MQGWTEQSGLCVAGGGYDGSLFACVSCDALASADFTPKVSAALLQIFERRTRKARQPGQLGAVLASPALPEHAFRRAFAPLFQASA